MTKPTKYILKSRRIIISYNFFMNEFRQEATALTHRLFVQAIRRPSNIISNLLQPILWLFLFGALFKHVPLNLFNIDHTYNQFLSCGILIFTCFTGSLNAGLPLIFDREFGFLNRLLVTPLISKNSILLSSIILTVCITLLQSLVILLSSMQSCYYHLSFYKFIQIILLSSSITTTVSSLSLGLAFIMPGHIEFIAFILIINLPTLFASTALAPLYLMPYWLQIIARFNILTYAIEAVRFITTSNYSNYSTLSLFKTHLMLSHLFSLLITLSILTTTVTTILIQKRLK